MRLKKENILPIIMNALREDIGNGDITSALIFDKDVTILANIIANEACVLAGIDIARWIFNVLDERIDFKSFCDDASSIKKDKRVASLRGSAKAILSGERVALNFLGRLSGIATLTNKFLENTKGTGVDIFDTRKTTPGLRELEKYAVKVGGGKNHRMGLWDGVLIKDNYLAAMRPYSIQDTLRKAGNKGYRNIEIEVSNLKEFKEALDAGADIIMLDNMKVDDIRKAVRLKAIGHKLQGTSVILEVSGGVTLDNVRTIAKTGVDRVSIGSLTHSAPSIDFSLEILR
jgi:nicotinate-nucleotide pyrophosphorylase (carboxylating)